MDSDQKPPLGAEIYEEIALAQYEVDRTYWARLNELRHSSFLDIANIAALNRPSPPLPRQPVRLCRILQEYAHALFDVEAKRYPSTSELKNWLNDLAPRIENRVMSAALQSGGLSGSLTYHATAEHMRATVHLTLAAQIEAPLILSPLKILVGTVSQHSLPAPANAPIRLRATINCPSAARKMEKFIQDKGISQTNFAGYAQTTDRTLRSFRKTGKVRRDIFDNIAKAMGTTKEKLMKD